MKSRPGLAALVVLVLVGAFPGSAAFHERAAQGVARALRKGLKSPRRVTHLGTGQAKVEKLASNRRYLTGGGRPAFGRTSATRDPDVRARPEGLIDPWLKTLSFWDG